MDNDGNRKRVLVFSNGGKTSGGSGFVTLVRNSRTNQPILAGADIVGVVSSIPDGNVRRLARDLDVPFECLRTYEASDYRALWDQFRADHVHLSGWIQMVRGLEPKDTTNIHPGKLAGFGGQGKYGHYVHDAVREAYLCGEVTQSAVSMHFATDQYDDPRTRFFEYPVALPQPIDRSLTAEQIGRMVNEVERAWQSYMLSLVLNGSIRLETSVVDGVTQYDVRFADDCPRLFFE